MVQGPPSLCFSKFGGLAKDPEIRRGVTWHEPMFSEFLGLPGPQSQGFGLLGHSQAAVIFGFLYPYSQFI